MNSDNFDADVAVIGGGLAGVRAAAQLHAGGASVLVLEARDRLGGRTYTRPLGGAAFDFGGQSIGPGQPRMYQLVKDLGLEIAPAHVAGRKVLELGGKATTYAGTIPFINPLKLLTLQLILKRIERLSRQIPSEAPWDAPHASSLDSLTLEAWRRPAWAIGTEVRRLMDVVVRTVFGADAGELSLLHFLWFVSSNGGLMPLVETKGGFQQDRIVGGTQQISERLGATLSRDRIRLNAAVRTIRQDENGVTVESSSESWRAKRVVVAVPLAIAGRISYEPLLPTARDQIHQRVAMGSTVKIFATYERAFWRERGLSGEAVGTSGAISVAFDNTSNDGSVPCLLGFVVGRPARTFATMPREYRRAQMLEELARFFGPEARTPLEYAEMDWGEERFSGGCPIGNFPPGTLSVFGNALRMPVGRLHWAGTEIARQCVGYMEGAIESGDRVAEEILTVL
ncbi:MAG: FAD-dependent oxidoreductase [Gammaproteobacteria bacterium]|nr:FAD-dependent oxidoreductase [Gammaproteobacteria bacterium]